MVTFVKFLGLVLFFSPVRSAQVCPADTPIHIHAPHENIWAPLSKSVTEDIEKWLYQKVELNLTVFGKAGLSDNSITLIETLMPNKTAALPYINEKSPSAKSSKPPTHWDRSGPPSPPPQFARVILYNGGTKIPVVKELMVGPLPVSSATTYQPLSYIYQHSTVPGVSDVGVFPYNARFPAGIELVALTNFMLTWTTVLAEATTDLFGGAFTGAPDDLLHFSFQGPNSFDGSSRRFWLFFTGSGHGGLYLAPAGFFVNVDLSGTDTNLWHVRRIVYNHQIFSGVNEFLAAYKSGTLKRSVKPDLVNTKWASRERRGKTRPLEDREASTSLYTDGSRIKTDKEAGYVEWMGWSFYVGFNRDTGLTLWDIRFKGERIIYELSLQDALAQYGGNDPLQSSTAFLDRHYGIGWGTLELLPGYDCPHGGVAFNASYHVEGAYFVHPGAICIFEHDTGFPTSRHYDRTNKWYGTSKGSSLRVRSMSADNYDYMFDYIFYLQGSVEVQMGASGYIQSSYWDALQSDYGTRLEKTVMGNIHSHIINYKIDLDVFGTANSLQKIDLVVERVVKPYLDPEVGPLPHLRVDRKWVDTESTFDLGVNGQTMLLIANKAVNNSWGNPKAYRIAPGYHTAHNPITGSPWQLYSAKWAEHDITVVKHKDTEPSSSTTWNENLSLAPANDFSKFHTPAESINQEDLVVYFNLGMHHLPRAEDVPNTLFADSRSSFIFSPFNYFDEDPSRDIQNAILLVTNEDGVFEVGEAGVGDDGKQCTLRDHPKAGTGFLGQVFYDTST